MSRIYRKINLSGLINTQDACTALIVDMVAKKIFTKLNAKNSSGPLEAKRSPLK
jgi:hypothetical protein